MQRFVHPVFSRVPLLVLLFAVAYGGVAGAEEPVPWGLRDHYTFDSDRASFHVDVKNARWKLEVSGVGVVFDEVDAGIRLADGQTYRVSDATFVRDDRVERNEWFGEGTHFRSQFQVTEELAVRYVVVRYKKHPFIVIYLEVGNSGIRPIDISEIRPVLIRNDEIVRLRELAELTFVRTTQRGRFPMIHADNAASLVRAELSDPRWTIGLGVVQSGRMDSKVVFPAEGETGPGYVSSRFDPPYRLDPGKTLRTDPVWLSFGTRAPDRVLDYHSWAQSAVPGPEQGEALPRNWVTLDRDASADDLYRLAKQWRDQPGRHVLVPLSWRANAGELSGAKPHYPEDMSVVARKLRKLGMIPGISIDPLAVQDGAREWTHAARNRVQWVDVGHPEAREFASARVRQIGEWGFDFFVVTPSEIPDSALRRFNVTRSEADLFALKIATDAAQGRSVLPSASFTLPVDGGIFDEAVGMIAVYENYGVVPGPVRLRIDG
ncbi:MAG: hypothetical protein IIB38_11650, partial [Candidatus Hydrogenedentes bacterium]|nr:hypothetical protein [Candidatus Hydrogenedentota bacterium]